MEKWEVAVCKRRPDLNQRRLNLLEKLDSMLLETKQQLKTLNSNKTSKVDRK